MKRHVIFWMIAVAVAAAPLWSVAQDVTDVDAIVQKTNQQAYYQGDDGRAVVEMVITDGQGRTRQKKLVILRKNMDDKNEEQNFFVYFLEPADESGVTFLVNKHVNKDDDRWLYLPKLDVTKRIAASDKRTSFVGSHFFYEDVSGRPLTEDTHELVETNDTYYVLKNTPKDPKTVEFDSFTMYIHKPTFIPVKVEYEKGGQVYRTVEALEVKDIQGFKTVTKSRVTDNNIGGNTLMTYGTVEYNTGLPDDIFTERYLRTPPTQYLGAGK